MECKPTKRGILVAKSNSSAQDEKKHFTPGQIKYHLEYPRYYQNIGLLSIICINDQM